MKKRNISTRRSLEDNSSANSPHFSPSSSPNPHSLSPSSPSTSNSFRNNLQSIIKDINSFRPIYPKPSDRLQDFSSEYVTDHHIMLWYYNASELVCEESLNKLLFVSEDPKQRHPLATAFLALLHSENIHFPNILNKPRAMEIAQMVFPYLLDNVYPVMLYDAYQESLALASSEVSSDPNSSSTNPSTDTPATSQPASTSKDAKFNFYNSSETSYYSQLLVKIQDVKLSDLGITAPSQEQRDLCMFSEYIIGNYYEKGLLRHSPNENYHEAFQWYMSSANRGFFMAQVAAGYLCEYGFPGVSIDLNKAIELYRESSKQGDATALYNLGIFYDTGKVVEKNDRKALLYYLESSQQGFDKAQLQLGNYFNDIIGDYKESLKWYKLSANKNNPEAQFCLGLIYFHGQGTKKNHPLARKYFELSSRNPIAPDSEAQFYLAKCYLEGIGGPVDFKEAREWAEKSLLNGESKAQEVLDNLTKKNK